MRKKYTTPDVEVEPVKMQPLLSVSDYWEEEGMSEGEACANTIDSFEEDE